AALSREGVDDTYVAGVLVRMSSPDKTLRAEVVVDDAAAWKAAIGDNLVRVDDVVDSRGRATMAFRLRNVDATSAGLTFTPWYSLHDARYAVYVTLVEAGSSAPDPAGREGQ